MWSKPRRFAADGREIMLDLGNVFILTQKELRDASRNRWLALFTVAFITLSLALAWLALSGSGQLGVAGFGRTAASLVNLVLLIAPLMGLTLGALSLAGERERGTLATLMAQPITQVEMLLGKFSGLALALVAALGLGFGITAVVIAFNGGGSQLGAYVGLVGLTGLLAIASLSLGFLLSAATQRGATAIGLALFLWLALVFFGDLGLMGTALVMRLDVGQLLVASLINPLQVFKIAAVLTLRGNLEILGPAGVYAMRTAGNALLPLLISLLILWAATPFAGAVWLFRRRGVS
jgi:Cu-processing system permease protein